MASNLRRIYLVNKEVQLRFVAWVVFVSLITSLILVACVALFSGNIIKEASEFGLTQDELAVAFILVQQKKILINLLLVLIGNMILIGALGFFFSHRIAGPIYRLEKFLKQVAEGDLSGTLKFRKGDQFHHIADTVNVMIECIRQKRRDELTTLKSVQKLLRADGKENEARTMIDDLCQQGEAEFANLLPANPQANAAPRLEKTSTKAG